MNKKKQKGIGFFENLDKTLSSESTADFNQHLEAVEQKAEQKTRQFFEQKRTEEKTIWSAGQQEVQFQIKSIQAELQKIAQELPNLDQGIKNIAQEAIVNPGVYHLNFLKRLQSLIALIRKKVQESKSWLSEWKNYCKKKRGYYGLQAQKSGTKFTLSSERYMATQAG